MYFTLNDLLFFIRQKTLLWHQFLDDFEFPSMTKIPIVWPFELAPCGL